MNGHHHNPEKNRFARGITALAVGSLLLVVTSVLANEEKAEEKPAAPAPAPAPVLDKKGPVVPAAKPANHASHGLPQTNSAPATATNYMSEVPSEIQLALRDTQAVLTSTNLVSSPIVTTEVDDSERIEQLRLKVEVARQQRLNKNYQLAESVLVSVMEANPPEDLQRSALLELAMVAQQQGLITRAQQIFSQYIRRYPEDPSVPEILLRQGLLYRQAGANTLALAKFYAVMTTALNLKVDRLDYYQRLVLQAQTEIADTYYLEGQYAKAVDFLNRLMQLDTKDLNKPVIHYKLALSLSQLDRPTEVVAQAQSFLTRYPNDTNQAEVRFFLVRALKKLGHKEEALKQVLTLLQSQKQAASVTPQSWVYWQQRAGNELANQFYNDGDYLNALSIYLNLINLNSAPAWQLPVLYQVGLSYEHLHQPQKASETYTTIISTGKRVDQQAFPALAMILDMAKWRQDYLTWYSTAQKTKESFEPPPPPTPIAPTAPEAAPTPTKP